MYNFSAATLSIPELDAIISHCSGRVMDIIGDEGELRGELTDDEVEEQYEYWHNVKTACKEELDERIKQIFKP